MTLSMNLMDLVVQMQERMAKMEEKMTNMVHEAREIIESEIRQTFLPQQQSETLFGIYLAIVISTKDPWRQNRVQFFCPKIHDLEGQSVDNLPWADPISAFGGFDDCGLTWIPPAGSYLVIGFHGGNRDGPFYFGTTWFRHRGDPDEAEDFFAPELIPEYQRFFQGTRGGYIVGPDDESQVFPPFNTDNYHAFDPTSLSEVSFAQEGNQELDTIAHQYGWKTPEKHMYRAVDGDPKCNYRWKRMEWQSSTGQYMIFKDDHLHYCGSWTNPLCPGGSDPTADGITDTGEENYPDSPEGTDDSRNEGTTLCPNESDLSNCSVQGPPGITSTIKDPPDTEQSLAETDPDISTVVKNLAGTPSSCCGIPCNNTGQNKYFKQRQECIPFLNNYCCLPQSGIQMISRAGYTFCMDESTEIPKGVPNWMMGLQPFDFDGCTNVYKGRTFWKSATGHCIEMSDHEETPRIRSKWNGIRAQTATGNMLVMSDHSTGDEDGGNCLSGEERGIHVRTTSNHVFDMIDGDGLKICSDVRKGCKEGDNTAKNAFIRLRTGYGIEIRMQDDHSQQNTDRQYFEILSPQKDNTQRGPHVIHMQEQPEGPGQVYIRSGGDYINMCYDNSFEVVGDIEENPGDKVEYVTRSKIMYTKDLYYNKSGLHCFFADQYILLLARDACMDPSGNCGPCMYPVVVTCDGIPDIITELFGLKASEFVFASAKACPGDLSCSDDSTTTTPGSSNTESSSGSKPTSQTDTMTEKEPGGSMFTSQGELALQSGEEP
jgi:hypothetical protein